MGVNKLIKEANQKAELQQVMYGDKPKTKVNPTKPIIEINQENSLWISHCINKKSKKPLGLTLDIKISIAYVRVILMQNGQEIGTAHSKYDINEAINKVKEAFGVNNLFNFINGKN